MVAAKSGLSQLISDRLRRFPGTALYYAIKLAPVDLGDPAYVERMIAKDRAKGPKLPSRRSLAKLDFWEDVEAGLRTFHARRKGAPATPLRLLFLHGGAFIMNFQTTQWTIPVGLLDRVDAEVVARSIHSAPRRTGRRRPPRSSSITSPSPKLTARRTSSCSEIPRAPP
jgi:hypothetical protein